MEDEGDVQQEIISMAANSPSSNGVAECLVSIARNGTQAILQDLGLLQWFWVGNMHVPAELDTNNGRMLFELFYGIKQDGRHIHILGCVVKVALPRESWTTGQQWVICWRKKNSGQFLGLDTKDRHKGEWRHHLLCRTSFCIAWQWSGSWSGRGGRGGTSPRCILGLGHQASPQL